MQKAIAPPVTSARPLSLGGISRIFPHLVLLFLTFTSIMPFVWMFFSSLKPSTEVLSSGSELFGSRLEGRLGPGRFLALFLLAGAAAAILQVSALPSSTTPMIGASGAIAGLLGAFTRTFPRARVRCLVCVLFFVTSVRLPSLLMLGLWLLVQVAAMGAAGPGTASVAWYAHVGGFVAGLGLGRLDRVGCANGAKARRGGPGARSGWPGAAVATPG